MTAIGKDPESFVGEAKHTEMSGRGGLTSEELDFVENFPEEKRKKVLSKIDVGLCREGNPWN